MTAFADSAEALICGTPDPALLLLSERLPVAQPTPAQAFRRELQQPRAGRDTLVCFQAPAALQPEFARLLQKWNYALALEKAINSFAHTAAVLRELELLGGRAPDLAVAGLSDDARVQLYRYVTRALETEWGALFARAAARSLRLGGAASELVRIEADRLRKDVQRWTDQAEEALRAFQ